MGHDDAVYGDSTLWGCCYKSIVSTARIAITFMTRPYKNSLTSCFQKRKEIIEKNGKIEGRVYDRGR